MRCIFVLGTDYFLTKQEQNFYALSKNGFTIYISFYLSLNLSICVSRKILISLLPLLSLNRLFEQWCASNLYFYILLVIVFWNFSICVSGKDFERCVTLVGLWLLLPLPQLGLSSPKLREGAGTSEPVEELSRAKNKSKHFPTHKWRRSLTVS